MVSVFFQRSERYRNGSTQGYAGEGWSRGRAGDNGTKTGGGGTGDAHVQGRKFSGGGGEKIKKLKNTVSAEFALKPTTNPSPETNSRRGDGGRRKTGEGGGRRGPSISKNGGGGRGTGARNPGSNHYLHRSVLLFAGSTMTKDCPIENTIDHPLVKIYIRKGQCETSNRS